MSWSQDSLKEEKNRKTPSLIWMPKTFIRKSSVFFESSEVILTDQIMKVQLHAEFKTACIWCCLFKCHLPRGCWKVVISAGCSGNWKMFFIAAESWKQEKTLCPMKSFSMTMWKAVPCPDTLFPWLQIPPCACPWELAGIQQKYRRMMPAQAWAASRRGRISKERKCPRISINCVIKTARKRMSVSSHSWLTETISSFSQFLHGKRINYSWSPLYFLRELRLESDWTSKQHSEKVCQYFSHKICITPPNKQML